MPRWLGPLASLARSASSRSRASSCARTPRTVVDQLRRALRAPRGAVQVRPARAPAAGPRAHRDDRLAPDFAGGGGGLPRFLVGGAVISGAGRRSAARSSGVSSGGGPGVDRRSASRAVRHLRAPSPGSSCRAPPSRTVARRLILHEPLDALWETIGACGASAARRLHDVRHRRHPADGRRLVRDARDRRGRCSTSRADRSPQTARATPPVAETPIRSPARPPAAPPRPLLEIQPCIARPCSPPRRSPPALALAAPALADHRHHGARRAPSAPASRSR